jgi:hypothetical protein
MPCTRPLVSGRYYFKVRAKGREDEGDHANRPSPTYPSVGDELHFLAHIWG